MPKDNTTKVKRVARKVHALLSDPDLPPLILDHVRDAMLTIIVEEIYSSDWPLEIFEGALTVYMSDEKGGE